ncbi:hypothetical protein WR25_23688 [Diploscapter pachys]|uniref:Carboxyltransferase domain-containing protein n=1 Tax=Diploscapter pachys TaxID=2018661 RepID=A0A2A2KD62_9BILA|nr:hypothetical protein WR25_23688 [Diploscapter pachys]
MFGVTPAPIYDPQQNLGYLKEHMVFFRPGDIVQFKSMDRDAYDHAVAEVEAGRFDLRIRPVLKPGLATSVQDLGREGYYHLGIPPSGALDQYALSAANQLVGNPANSAALECTLLGPELEFQQDALVAVCGAQMTPKVDGVDMHLDTAFEVKAGQVLRFDFPKAGARAYLAVAGGIDVPVVLGSRSTYTLGALGGFQGRRLVMGDELPIGTASGKGCVGASLPMALRQSLGGEITLRVVPGLYYDRLTLAAADSFFAEAWTVGSEADRIGYRFKDATQPEGPLRRGDSGRGAANPTFLQEKTQLSEQAVPFLICPPYCAGKAKKGKSTPPLGTGRLPALEPLT